MKNQFLAGRFARIGILTCLASMLTIPCRADLWGLSTPANGTPAAGTEGNYNKVFRFDEQGNKVEPDIDADAGIYFPTGIAVGPDGNIYVSSYATGSILYFNGQTGTSLGTFAGDFGPAQLAFGPDGNLYVSEFFGTNVRVYDDHTGANFGQRLADAATGLTSAQGLAFAANGDLLVGDGFAMTATEVARIVRVHKDENGDLHQSTWGYTDQGAFFAPVAMLTQSNGDVLVVDMLANYVLRVSDAGIPTQLFASINPPVAPPQTNYPSDITFDPNGNIVLSVLGATNPPDNRGALWRYDLSGNIIDPDNNPTNEPIASGLEPIAGIDYTPSLATLAGNYDNDTVIGASDYAKWRQNFGKFVAQGNNADGNSNGIVDAADYVLWRKASESTAAEVLSEATVPEPSGLAILLNGLFAAWGTCRRLRRSKG